MQNSDVTENMLRDILDQLKARGFEQRGVSIRIGWDEKGFSLADALRGKSKKKLNEAYRLINQEFAIELGKDAPAVKYIPQKQSWEIVMERLDAIEIGLNEKLDRILELLNK